MENDKLKCKITHRAVYNEACSSPRPGGGWEGVGHKKITKNLPHPSPPLARGGGKQAFCFLRHDKLGADGGYALIFAVLTASILLSAGLGIANIVYKQLLISAIGRQSVAAFYAADTGAECAIHWSQEGGIFKANDSESSNPGGATCAGHNLSDTSNVEWTDGPAANNFARTTFSLPTPGGGCAIVTVRKVSAVTDIESRGFNTPCDDSGSNRRVERALRFRLVADPPPAP